MSATPKPKLTARERILRLVNAFLELPEVAESPFASMIMLSKPIIFANLRSLDETTAAEHIAKLQRLLDGVID